MCVVVVVAQTANHLPKPRLWTGPFPGQRNGGPGLGENESILQRLVLFPERTNLTGLGETNGRSQWRQEGTQPAQETSPWDTEKSTGRPSAPLGLSLTNRTVL